MTAWEWVLVGVAGAVGAPLRYLVDTVISERVEGRFPLGTLAVNISGSFVLGLLGGVARSTHEVLGTGLIGAYTTFSTFSFETVRLMEEGDGRSAALNIVTSLIAGTLAAAAGLALVGA